MASLSAVRDGIKAQLAAITGLRVYDTIPDQISPPAAVVAPASGTFLEFDSTMARGSDDLHFVVALLVARGSDRAAQDTLDGYLAGSGAASVKAAIESGGTLGGAVQWVSVPAARNYGSLDIGGVSYLGCEFVVDVGV
jgi:hypothetical protein